MKILICTFEYPPVGSGIANVAFNLNNEFAKKHRTEICSPVGPDVKIGNWKLIEKSGGIGILFYWWRTGKFLKKNLKNYDAVLLENPLLLHRIYSRKIKATTHTTYKEFYYQVKISSGFALKMYYMFMKMVEKWSFKRMDKRIKFTSASDCVTEELVLLGVRRKNILYISNGADTERFRPVSEKKKKHLKKKYRIDENRITLLFVGRLECQHKPQEMIQIYNALKKKRKDIQLLVVGSGSLEKETKRLAKKAKSRNIKFISRIEYRNLHEAYQLADFFFLNSIYTGQSLAMLEAISSGLPLIVPGITEFQRIVKDSRAGFLYTPKNPEKAAKEILKYLEKANIKKEQKSQREYAEKKISWKNIAKQYLSYLNS